MGGCCYIVDNIHLIHVQSKWGGGVVVALYLLFITKISEL